jgi:hypothetical protein
MKHFYVILYIVLLIRKGGMFVKRYWSVVMAFVFIFSISLSQPVFSAPDLAVKPSATYEAEAADTVVTVSAKIAEIRGYDSDYEHQQILVNNINVLDIENGNASDIPSRAFVAIRIDESGIGGEIPNLRVGASIVIKGEFIPEDEAYKTPDNCCDAVIHFTHDPVGYVQYDGVTYR